ncbi:hypothetical protein H6F71_27280 [Microcoleus sp. FACHB-61]|nr:hypothetical protein [Microcoleus sp. FACHB-61]
MWTGASFAKESKDPDYARHLIRYLRRLITHILHRLAADKKMPDGLHILVYSIIKTQ